MIKKTKKVTSKTEPRPQWEEMISSEIKPKVGIDKLTLSFPNEDLNKLVEKINEIIEHDTI